MSCSMPLSTVVSLWSTGSRRRRMISHQTYAPEKARIKTRFVPSRGTFVPCADGPVRDV
jgi:hypothetical protein